MEMNVMELKWGVTNLCLLFKGSKDMELGPFSPDEFQHILKCDLSWPLKAFNPILDFEALVDEDLLLFFQQGTPPQREAAFITLFNRYLDLDEYIRKKAPSEDVTKDIFSKTWLVILQNPSKYDPRQGPFRNWLQGIAWKLLLEYFREPHSVPLDDITEQVLSYIEQVFDSDLSSSSTPTSKQIQEKADQLVQRLLKELKSLDPVADKVIRLIYFEGKNSTEIGKALKLKPCTVRKIHERALKRLRKIAQNYDNLTRTR
jgi:RNA polymerase sigma factor (sigma-70 family)